MSLKMHLVLEAVIHAQYPTNPHCLSMCLGRHGQ